MVTLLGIVLSSCDDNDVDVFGSADLKVVNAAPNSGSQRFVLANIPEISDLDYLDNSVGYLNVASGNDLVAQFRDQDDNDLYATEKFDIQDNRDYTIYLTGESGSDAEVRLFQDDFAAPASGKAKVKFIHLSTGAPASLDINNAEGNALATNVARYSQSNYFEVDAGTIALQAHSAGSGEAIATLGATDFAAGKIYTVYIAGSATSGYTLKTLQHN
ncbi:DUF4397 domain-containing protein [Flavobacterium zepuense]|nr:DUF4397 domain-containing protein [Flavobacterium zepuense]